MEIILALVLGTVVGIAAHFLAPGRDVRGVALAPILGALASALVWMILTWTGVGTDSIWLWLSAIVAPAAVTFPVLAVLTRIRHAHDANERARLKIA